MNVLLKVCPALVLVASCSGTSSEHAVTQKHPMIIKANDERRLQWFQDGMTRVDSGADSVEYSPNKLTTYYDSKAEVFNGTVDVDTTLSVEEIIGKRYEKAHKPVVYKNTVEDTGLASDNVEMFDSSNEEYKCDLVLDYGNKIVGYYRSSRTLEFTNFKKHEVIMFTVSPPKSIKTDSLSK